MHKQPINLPITALSGVGTALAIRLGELGIYRVFDMLMHLPRDYEDRSRIIPMRPCPMRIRRRPSAKP